MNKQSLIIATLLLVTVSFTSAQGLERKSISNSSELIISGSADVFLSISSEAGISASEADFGKISYDTNNGALNLATGSADVVYLAMPSLEKLITSGSGNFVSSDTLKGNNLEITTSGTGSVNLLLTYSDITVVVGGASDIKLTGKADFLNANVSGAGDLSAYKMPVKKAKVNLSGAGDAQVYVINELRGNVSGAGTLYHRGNPSIMEVEVSGAGEVKRSNNLNSSDTTRITLGNKKIIILDNDENTEIEIGDDVMVDGEIQNSSKPKKPSVPSIWSGFELGINGYLNSNNSFNMDSVNSDWALNYGKSVVVNFNVWEKTGRILKENITVTTGLGAEINNYRFDKNVRLLSDTIPVVATVESNVNYEKTKLVTGFLNVPLYLTFASNEFKNGKRLSISPGVTGAWRFTTYNKRVVNEDGDRNKSRNNDDFNLNPFRVNASVRLGYGSFILFANYSVTSMFKNNQGPDLMPFSAGIRLVGL
ncbi:MAG: head GIN domain-containing protein [Bacteroidia bacterium]